MGVAVLMSGITLGSFIAAVARIIAQDFSRRVMRRVVFACSAAKRPPRSPLMVGASGHDGVFAAQRLFQRGVPGPVVGKALGDEVHQQVDL